MDQQVDSIETSSSTPQPREQNSPPINKNKSINKLILILALLLFIVTLVACYFAYQNYYLQKNITKLQFELNTTPAISQSELPEEQVTTEFEQSSNVPRIPGANIFITAVNENNTQIQKGIIKISVEYKDFPDRNYDYSVNLDSIENGLLALSPPPSQLLATISIKIEIPDGGESDTLIIKNDEYWQAVEKTNSDYVGTHQFDLSQPDKVSYLTYSP